MVDPCYPFAYLTVIWVSGATVSEAQNPRFVCQKMRAKLSNFSLVLALRHGARHKNWDMTCAAGKGMILSRYRMKLVNSRDRSDAPLPRVKHGFSLLSLLLLDHLASEVVRFNRAYAPGFVFIPSSTSLMFGLNNRHIGADRFKRHPVTLTRGVKLASKKTQISFPQGSGHGDSHPHRTNEFAMALVEGRDPFPCAVQSRQLDRRWPLRS